MFIVTRFSRKAQRVVCGILATVVVVASLSIGVFGAQSALHEGYSVTITQLQCSSSCPLPASRLARRQPWHPQGRWPTGQVGKN